MSLAERIRAHAERLWLEALADPRLSQVTARLSDLQPPPAVLQPLLRFYTALYGVDMSAAADPLDTFDTFDAFFTRRLRPGVRPIDPEPGCLVSPADARLDAGGPIPPDRRLPQIKGRAGYSLDELLGEDASRFGDGVFATLYLSPKDYHRIHAPLSGVLTRWRYMPGRRYPVNSLAVGRIDALFCVNERLAVFLDTPDGEVAAVLVGASNVSRISLDAAGVSTAGGLAPGDGAPPRRLEIERGAELGAFHLGSTVVIAAADPGWRSSGRCPSLSVRVGQALFRR